MIRAFKHLIRRCWLYGFYQAPPVNIYHCCVQKTASQWVRAILSDKRTYKYSGLSSYSYQSTLPGGYDPRSITQRTFKVAFPEGTIISPIYIDFHNYMTLPKPRHHKTFFVMRDPRDIVISWYFSARYSHPSMGRLTQVRDLLNKISINEGILYSIGFLHDFGLFAALRSWIEAPRKDPDMLLLRYEDITASDNLEIFKELFSHCNIPMPDRMLSQLLHDYNFERLSGRKRGEEDRFAHYRKGVPGEWRKYVDEPIKEKFKKLTNDLVVRLEYETDPNW